MRICATPWKRNDYIRKFEILTEDLLDPKEARRFLGLVQEPPILRAGQLVGLNIALPEGKLTSNTRRGIF